MSSKEYERALYIRRQFEAKKQVEAEKKEALQRRQETAEKHTKGKK